MEYTFLPESIIIFKEKHGERKFKIPSIKDLYEVALKIVTERYRDDWYVDSVLVEKRAKRALEFNDGAMAMRILTERLECEYEGWYITETEKP